MSSALHAFLHPVTFQEEKDFVVSTRFRDEDGKVHPFRIRALTQEENERAVALSIHVVLKDGAAVEKLDSKEYSSRLMLAATLEPNFAATELCQCYGTMDPVEVPARMLLAGEYARLSAEIMRISAFDDTPAGEKAIEEAVKN